MTKSDKTQKPLFTDALSVYQKALLKKIENIPEFFERNINSFSLDQLNEMNAKIEQILIKRGRLF